MSVRNSVSILKKIFIPQVTPMLGRWNRNNYKETALKIKYANEDNCGVCCGSENTVEAPQNNNIDETEYIYLMGYESVHK
jgi:hypothetical protein